MKLNQYQRGVTLFVALIFLLVMTLFAVSSVNMSTVNMRIVGNMQAIKQMEAVAQDAVEQILSDSGRYGLSPDESDIKVSFVTSAGKIEQTLAYSDDSTDLADCEVDAPYSWRNTDGSYLICAVCIDSNTATGYSAVQEAIIPEDTSWEIYILVEDPLTGAEVKLHQGIEMRMLAGNCPDPV